MKRVVIAMPIQDCYWLGYKPNSNKRKKQLEEKRKKRMVGLKRHKANGEPISFLQLYETFKSCGCKYLNPLPRDIGEIATTIEETHSTISIHVLEKKKRLRVFV